MKKTNRILSILLALCMLVGTIGVLPVSAIEYSSDYAISNVTYVPTGTLGSTQDMLQWSDVGAISYRLEIYDENDIVIDYAIRTENYVPAAQILPYSGEFHVVVTPLDENNVSVWSGTASDMFTYTDTTAPTASWWEDRTVRHSDSEATVQFDNLDRYSACTYYYAVVDSGEAAPAIDTGGTGIAANDGSDNYINLTGLTAGAKDIYLILKDQDGNAGEPIMTTIPAYVPTVKYWVSVTASPFDGSGGTVSGEGEYAPGEQVTISITPNTDSGYCAAQWGLSDIGGGVISAINQKTSHTFTMPENAVQISITFTQHSYITYSDLGDGTHQNKCFYCGVPNGVPENHIDAHGGGDGTTPPDGSCDLCSAELHTHTYSTEWSSDENGHWHECDCGAIDESSRQSHEKYAPGFSEEVHWLRCLECNYYFLDPEPHTMELRHDSLLLDSFGVDAHSWECTYCAYNLSSEDCTIAWEYDNTYHWGDCTECGYEKSKTAHDGEKSCATCGWSFARSAPTNLRWDTSNGTVAVWDAVDGATSYIVELWKKDIILLRLISHEVSDTSFEFYLTTLSAGSYYFTVMAVTEDIRSDEATSDDIMITSGGTPILINGSSERVDYIDGTAFIVDRDDIANGSVSDVNMTPITVSITLTNEQAVELINGWLASWDGFSFVDIYKNYTGYIRSQLEDYSLADLKVILSNLKRGLLPNDYIADVVIEKIESKKATNVVIAPGYIDSTSAFKVTTGQGLGVTYSNDALRDLLASVGTDSNVKVATKFEKTEITRDEARIIVAEWAEIVNTAEGEEQIKNLLTNYSIYELALLQQYTKILILEDSTEQKLYDLMWVEREKKKEQAAAKDNEEPLATFSVNTYAVAADGTQTYIPVSKSMQYAIPVDTSGIPENATLALYRVNEDGTRTKQEILSILDNLVIAQTDGNSDYVLVYKEKTTTTTSGGGGVSRYTVKFDTNEGSTIKSVTVTRNNKITEPTEPTKDGYIFGDWYLDEEFAEEYDFDSKVTKNITLYAKWITPEPQPTEWENPFTDVDVNDWFYENVMFVYENGLMKGTSETTFAPNTSVTRGMFVTVLYRAEGEPAVNRSIPFADVKADDYFANAVIWAQQNGIVKGISENEFAPNSSITREQMAAILYRYAQFKEYDVSVGENTNILSYNDFDKISEYAISAMQWACGSGLIKGRTESTLNPQDNATRAETAAILQRFIEGNVK